MISACPRRNLYESGANSVAANQRSASCRVARYSLLFAILTISQGEPISATARSPLYREAGGRIFAGFGEVKVTVTSAYGTTPSALPLSAHKPDGTSRATTSGPSGSTPYVWMNAATSA